jgi:hypothetical protein
MDDGLTVEAGAFFGGIGAPPVECSAFWRLAFSCASEVGEADNMNVAPVGLSGAWGLVWHIGVRIAEEARMLMKSRRFKPGFFIFERCERRRARGMKGGELFAPLA